jgi:hypothetical protein
MRTKTLVSAALFLAIAGFSNTAIACPNFNLSGETYSLTGTDLYTPRSFKVVAGGSNALSGCPNVRPQTESGPGYVTSTPDFTFSLSGLDPYRLDISVRSACDAMLLVNTGRANWYYDDDDNGNLDPKIVLTRPSSGWLDIWVGTYDGEACDAVLTLETFNR